MNEQAKPMTVKEILKDIRERLGNIRVPMSEIESIGTPIGWAINGIGMCVEAIERAEAEQEVTKANSETATDESPDGE